MRALVFDLDDTLLNSNKQIGPGTYRVLMNWLDRGEQIYLATSRPIRSVRRFIPPELLCRISAITLNGAVIYEIAEPAYQAARLGDAAKEALSYLLSRDSIHLTVEILGEHFASNIPLSEKQLWDIHSASADMLIEISSVNYAHVSKIAIDGQGQQLNDELTWLRAKEHFNPIPAQGNTFINLVSGAMDKADALTYLASKHRIDLSQVIVFGDDEPDRGMLKIAGLAVAMDNAIPAIKANADTTIGHHDDDCIGEFIESSLDQLMANNPRQSRGTAD